MTKRIEHLPMEAFSTTASTAGPAPRILVNEARKTGRAQYLNAQPHERTADRTDSATTVQAEAAMPLIGELGFAMPLVRYAGFYRSALEKGTHRAGDQHRLDREVTFKASQPPRVEASWSNSLDPRSPSPRPSSAGRRESWTLGSVGSIFPNTDSCLRLVFVHISEFNEECMIGKIDLNLKNCSLYLCAISCELSRKQIVLPILGGQSL